MDTTSPIEMTTDVNSIVSGQNPDILISIITKLLTSRPFGDLRRMIFHKLCRGRISSREGGGAVTVSRV